MLSEQEIKQRLQQLRNLEHLHAQARKRVPELKNKGFELGRLSDFVLK